ncbi:two-component regulator propeller domain-containing protein [Cellulophaga lytica]|uniref:hybrid sensor histidine kinase/response regulator transcription factor n=1 Tax=Cellulophaga lytica TaxID=979 RepID=UPI0026E434C9|nr:hybrid sensor histidine kinase/response regulator transcription factor [Cellulophaga lytica]MDO6854067.1 two-component regulator propeller domain-containing protein [Cellulophaga lytica]
MRKIISLVFLFIFCTSTYSQDSPKEYNFVSIKEGISKVGVSTIVQDHYGFIWMGTNGVGLYRYDGIDYTYYKHVLNDTTSLSSSLVYSSYLDKTNRLWFGTEEGLNLYDRDKDQFKKIYLTAEEKENKINIPIRSIEGDNNGNLFIGTVDLGLFKLNLKTLKAEKIENQYKYLPVDVYALKIDKNNKIYAGTSIGLQEYDSNTNKLKQSLLNTEDNSSAIKEGIQSLLVDKNNNIWVGTIDDGLYKIDHLLNTRNYPISDTKIFSMIQLPDNTIMLGTENNGLFHINTNGSVIKNYLSSKTDEKSILYNSIWSLFLDTNDRIWMGYYNSGVAVYDKLYDKFNNIESLNNTPNSLQIGSVTSIVQDSSGKLWISMDGGGIDIYNPTTKHFTHINKKENSTYSGLTSDYIEGLFIDSKENIWAVSWDNGIYMLKKGTNKFINFNITNTGGKLESNTVLSIDEDSEGTIWIGSFYGGLHSYNPKTEKITQHNTEIFVKNGITNSDIWKVLVDKEDNIWLGTTLGLFRIKKMTNGNFIVTSMTKRMSKEYKNQASANHILTLHEDSLGNIWIGTKGAGLCKHNPKLDTFSWYNKFNGLTEENVCGIIECKEGNIWVTGNSGISKIMVNQNKILNYTSNDGLLSNDFNINATYKDSKGQLYFGNYKGVDYFDPKKIQTNKNLTSIYLTDFKLFNKKVTPTQANSPLKKVISETDSISLTNKQSVFTIEYSGINYTRPEKNEYAYYLEGYEKNWNYVGATRNATYTNLDPGNYTFKLKASNNDGVWNEDPLELKITILPPWWKSVWAVIAYILLFLLGVYILNKMTQSRIKEKQIINNERDKRLQEKDLDEKKFQFFTNISHEFRTPLTLILNPLKDILNDTSLNLPSRTKDKLKIIHKNTDRLYRLINELLDFRKLELNRVNIKVRQLNLVAFTKEIVSHFTEEANSKNINLWVSSALEDLPIWADENKLEKIIFNILSNAMKVTPNGGAIKIKLEPKNKLTILPLVNPISPVKAIKITVSDTGPGLKKEQVKRIFERFYQVDNLNKTYYDGTGIGLEVVKSFVQLHKGKVEVNSTVGKGTKFKVILPAGKAHFTEDEIVPDIASTTITNNKITNSDKTKDTEEDIDNAPNPHTLLVVEDNTELRNYIKNEFKHLYKVLTAVNGTEGLKIAKESLPDVIITDVIMPEMNGYKFCQSIKNDLKTSHIPLLMLTAKARIDDRIEGIETGADAYMVKPFDMRLLKLRVSQLITSRQLIFNKYFSLINDVPKNINTTSLDKEFIQKVLVYINDNIDDPELNVESLASELNLSRSQFYRKIKALTNQTASEFLRNIRLQKAKQIIEMGNTNISEVSYKVGFSSPSYFTKCFKNYFDMLPTDVKPTNT